MTESLRSDGSHPDDLAVLPVSGFESEGRELEPAVVVEQFLNQCQHTNAGTRANLAEFILAALKETPESDWVKILQAQKVVPEDEDYIRLMKEDKIYEGISTLSHRTRPMVGHGNVLALERKALIELMELRAGQSLAAGDPSALQHLDQKWGAVIDKLFKGWESIRN